MPAASSRLSKRAHARIALRKKKHAKEANNNNLIEMATASSSPTGVNDFVSDFNNGDDKRYDDTSSVDKVNRKSIEVEQEHTPVTKNTSYYRKNNDDDDDDDKASVDEGSRSIAVQNSPVITAKSIGKTINVGNNSKLNEEQEDDSPTKCQVNVNVTTRKYHEPRKAKAGQSIAIDNSFLWRKKKVLDDEMTIESSMNISRLPDEGFVDRIEGIFLNGIEGIEDRLASLVPACISPDSTGGCQLFDPFDV
ncbi:hypothetical protein ACHAWT_000043 [Skeletonema menzelii]